jgi:hypothetical protein
MACFFNSAPWLINCMINTNSASAGAGVYCGERSEPVFTNCTIAANSGERGGGIYCTSDSGPRLASCVLWADTPEEIYVFSGAPVVSYCDVQGGWEGAGNINADPLFVDPDGPDNDPETWADNNYRLTSGSPCIDAGDNTAVPPDTQDLDGDGNTSEPLPFDLDGNRRFVDDPDTPDTGNGPPPIVDMGAFELQVDAGGCTRQPAWVCDGDVDGNGAVNPVDVGLVQAAFCVAGSCAEQDLCQYDLDCNGAINPVDSGLVQSLFGTCDPPRDPCP